MNKDAVKHKTSKMVETRVPLESLDSLDLLPRLAGTIAKATVPDEHFCRHVANQIAEHMPDEESPFRVVAEGKVCFVQGRYAVIEVIFKSADLQFLMENHLKDEAKVNRINEMLLLLGGYIGEQQLQEAVDTLLLNVVARKAEEHLGRHIMNEMRNEHKLEAVVHVNMEEDQARYFYKIVTAAEKKM